MSWADYWAKRRNEKRTGVIVDWYQKRLRVSAPYDPEFIALAHKYNGKWRARSKSWSFRMSVGHIIIGQVRIIFADYPIEIRKRESATF